MSDKFGPLNLENESNTNDDILKCKVELAKELEKCTLDILKNHYVQLETIARLLVENETIYHKDIVNVFNSDTLIT